MVGDMVRIQITVVVMLMMMLMLVMVDEKDAWEKRLMEAWVLKMASKYLRHSVQLKGSDENRPDASNPGCAMRQAFHRGSYSGHSRYKLPLKELDRYMCANS